MKSASALIRKLYNRTFFHFFINGKSSVGKCCQIGDFELSFPTGQRKEGEKIVVTKQESFIILDITHLSKNKKSVLL